jgi:two-component sensor histidine kinase/HAMP domain-containing protein
MAAGRRRASIAARVALSTAVTILPVLVVASYNAVSLRGLVYGASIGLIRQRVDQLSSQQFLVTQTTRLLLSTVAQTEVAASGDSAAFSKFLATLLSQNPLYVALSAFKPDGSFLAAASPSPGVNVSDRKYFRDLMAEPGFVIGQYAISRTTGKPTLHFAYPVRGRDGETVSAVLVASYDLGRYASLFSEGLGSPGLPSPGLAGRGLVAEAFDREGVRLFRFPESAAEPVGAPAAAFYLGLIRRAPAGVTVVERGPGGRDILGYRLLNQNDRPDADLFIVLRYPAAVIMGPATASIISSAVIIALSIMASAVLVRLMVRLAVTAPLAALLESAKRLGAGDYSTRSPGGRAAPTEIVALSGAFDEMAAAIHARQGERDAALKALTESLAEKEVLLKEIHHRVKNNFQIVSSLLSLQSSSLGDGPVQEALEDSQARIRSMSLIHETLYHSDSLSRVDFAEYVRTLSGELLSANAQVSGRAVLAFDLDDARLSVDAAIPLGLILNELLTNAFKHAFPAGSSGTVAVSLRSFAAAGGLELVVADDGIGLGAAGFAARRGSLGVDLVKALCAQLKAEIRIEGQKGTRVTVTVPSDPGIPPPNPGQRDPLR